MRTPGGTLTLDNLYAANTPAAFWGTGRAVSSQRWLEAAAGAVELLPGGRAALSRGGWAGLMEHVLGEAQFGAQRYRLKRPRRLYYRLRPMLPRRVTGRLRMIFGARAVRDFRLGWPIEDRFVQFMHALVEHVGVKPLPFWPGAARFALVLTHDVERSDGQSFVRKVADLDERYGFRSAFNFVPEDYAVDLSLVRELQERGFEVGLHGLKHDGSLFSSWTNFHAAVPRIDVHARRLGAIGFRSPATHRNPAWMQRLPFEYDSSFFDTDPFEVMPGGTMSIWQFLCGRFVELPYTLVQDHTLVTVLGHRSPRLWVEKTDFIARWGGMVLLNTHPDYLREDACWGVYEEFLAHLANLRPACAAYWHALPREVARWWRARCDENAPA